MKDTWEEGAFLEYKECARQSVVLQDTRDAALLSLTHPRHRLFLLVLYCKKNSLASGRSHVKIHGHRIWTQPWQHQSKIKRESRWRGQKNLQCETKRCSTVGDLVGTSTELEVWEGAGGKGGSIRTFEFGRRNKDEDEQDLFQILFFKKVTSFSFYLAPPCSCAALKGEEKWCLASQTPTLTLWQLLLVHVLSAPDTLVLCEPFARVRLRCVDKKANTPDTWDHCQKWWQGGGENENVVSEEFGEQQV